MVFGHQQTVCRAEVFHQVKTIHTSLYHPAGHSGIGLLDNADNMIDYFRFIIYVREKVLVAPSPVQPAQGADKRACHKHLGQCGAVAVDH